MHASQEINIPEPVVSRRLLDPIERISEILFGLIMVLSFTCAISVAEVNRIDVREILIAAVGCNLAWGIIDAVMYLINLWAQRGRDLAILNYVKRSGNRDKAIGYIRETLSPELSEIIGRESLQQIQQDVVHSSPEVMRLRVSVKDFKTALGIFLLVFLTTIPVAFPFAVIKEVYVAMRVSNGIAILLLFIGGWILARYGRFKKFRTGLCLALIGVGMVFLTIALGG
jgi:hypothetical protein